MRLARLALAGLAIGILAGFVAALLRPRPRIVEQQVRGVGEATGEPISWGERPRSAPKLPPLVPVVPKAVTE